MTPIELTLRVAEFNLNKTDNIQGILKRFYKWFPDSKPDKEPKTKKDIINLILGTDPIASDDGLLAFLKSVRMI